jgi:hypothetical protein
VNWKKPEVRLRHAQKGKGKQKREWAEGQRPTDVTPCCLPALQPGHISASGWKASLAPVSQLIHLVIGGLTRKSGRDVTAAAASSSSTAKTAAASNRVRNRCETSSAAFAGCALPATAPVEEAVGPMA